MIALTYMSVVMLGMVSDLGKYKSAVVGHGQYTHVPAKIMSNAQLYSAIICLITVIIRQTRKTYRSNSPLDFIYLVYTNFRFKCDSNANPLYRIFRKYIFWLALYNLLLLTHCNMSISNPGPQGLTVLYQNVQGLIPCSDLNNKHPSLNQTKMAELQSSVYTSSPDVLILNETWLKPSINDSEIFCPEKYKIFRCDRSPKSHPSDPNCTSKYRKNGGGVLIAIKTDLDINSNKVNFKCKAEVLSVELTFSNKSKICISTCYRVGTLGSENFNALESYYTSMLRSRKYGKVFIVGDFNLSSIGNLGWETGFSPIPTEQSFIDLFNNLGLTQLIQEPTHTKGNILDILLTNYNQSISNVVVKAENKICFSDHMPISFIIKSRVKRRKSPKITSHRDQADLYNEFFHAQFSEPSRYDITIDYNKNFDLDFDITEIYNILLHLDPNKAPGPDKIHGKILKKCAKSLALPLHILFRTSYYTCRIPNEWKLANVVPIYKKGSKNSVENYRPISLTSIIMKVYERVIRADLLKRCEHKLSKNQHGFLPGRSCETQLIPFYDNLACTLNNGSRTDIVYFDFQKAFDSVNHDIILNKLKIQFNIDGLLLKFFVEYLKDRKQCVIIGNEKSSLLPVLSGVPQGSIVGPLLFVIFINDIGDKISENSCISLYADDTKLYREIKYDHDQEALQKDIDVLNDWSLKNLMKFHPDKSKILSVTLCKPPIYSTVLPIYNFTYCLGNIPIDLTRSQRDLGVTINSTLTWTEHNNLLYSKANKNLGLLKCTCHFVKNIQQRRSLYLALIRSQFEHCSSVWSSNNTTTINKIESLQKKAIKWILSEEYYSYSEEIYYLKCKKLDLLPIKFRMQLKDLKLLHNIINNKSVIKLPYYIGFYTGGTRLRSSHLDNLCLISSIKPKITRNYNKSGELAVSSFSQFSNSFFFRTINSWNSLPLEIRQVNTITEFEQKVRSHLWEVARPTQNE